MCRCLISVVLLAILFLPANAAEAPAKRAFSAKAADVRLSAMLARQNIPLDSRVTVSVPARIFDAPLVIEDVQTAEKTNIPEIDLLVDYHREIMCGSEEEILAFWHPDEQPQMARYIHDEKMLANMRDYISKNPGLNIVGIVYQESSSAVLVSTRGYLVGHSIRKHGKKMCLSGKPADDLELAIIEASFLGDVSKKRE